MQPPKVHQVNVPKQWNGQSLQVDLDFREQRGQERLRVATCQGLGPKVHGLLFTLDPLLHLFVDG